jgi:hypothetical protein
MPVEYQTPQKVGTPPEIVKARITEIRIDLEHDDFAQDGVTFRFVGYKKVQATTPGGEPKVDEEGNPVMQDVRVTSGKVRKKLAEVAASHGEEFASVYAGLKKVGYELMVSENVFPAGTVV